MNGGQKTAFVKTFCTKKYDDILVLLLSAIENDIVIKSMKDNCITPFVQ